MELNRDIALRAERIGESVCRYFDRVDPDTKELSEAILYSLTSGGKRIRPYLTLEFCELFGGREDAAMPYACAVEMIHTYSLIHDDLPCMDNDDMRRGKPSCHAKFGETIALLAGDALLTEAFGAVSGNAAATAEQNVRALSILASAAGTHGMVGGQVMDLDTECDGSFERLCKLHSKKTGAMIRASVLMGCIAAGVAEDSREYADAASYAEKIGLTFQIIDDILDHREGESEEEKETFLTYLSEERSYEYAKKLTYEAISAIEKYEGSEMLVAFAKYLLDRQI